MQPSEYVRSDFAFASQNLKFVGKMSDALVFRLECNRTLLLGRRTAKQLSFEWSQFKISRRDSKVRTILYSIINITTEKAVQLIQ